MFYIVKIINFVEKNTLNTSINLSRKNYLPRSLRSSFLTNTKFLKKNKKDKIIYLPNKRKLNFDLLNVFYVLILCGNIALASERLSISQPAISLCINKLEKECGVLLFQQLNSRKLLKLTSSGLVLFNYIQRLFQIIQESLDISNSMFLVSSICNLRQSVYNNSNSQYTSIINRRVFYPNNKFLTFYNFSSSLKYLVKLRFDTFKYFETSSRILISKYKFNYCQILTEPLKSSNNKINFDRIELDKLTPIKLLNTDFSNSLKNLTLIEVQTSKALNVCLELKISTLICWGSEF